MIVRSTPPEIINVLKQVVTGISASILASAANAQCVPSPSNFCVRHTGANYTINGLSRPTIELVRGQTYTFQMVSVPGSHPFYITTSSTGGGGGSVTASVSGNSTLFFTVPVNAPNTLYYQCFVHIGMGGRINVVNPPCRADFNGDGFLDGFDYDEFVQCFEGGRCPSGRSADFNGDGFADGFDYDEFVAEFEMGCG